MNNVNIYRKLIFNICLTIILVVCFLVTTYAMTKQTMSIDDNFFKTGKIKINLNDGQAIINENEFIFEPGITITKDFFIENQSTFDVYYKIYFTDVSGDLSDILEVTIKNGEEILYKGTINDLSRTKVKTVDNALKINEKVVLSASFHYPEDSQNNTQNSNVSFKLSADAVQVKNNPNKAFE